MYKKLLTKIEKKKYYIVGILQKSNRKWQKQGKLYP